MAAIVFGTPREMIRDEISSVVAAFADAARLSAEAGFAGVEIHAAHGYLLSQFLSESSNQRSDEYGGSPKNRARIVVQVIHAIRSVTPKGFCVGIKLNSADGQSQRELAHRIEQLQDITAAGVDFIEISGGTYSQPTFVMAGPEKSAKSASTLAREAFFLDFALAIRSHFPGVPLILTGGFRTRAGMEAALREGACDIVGIGRRQSCMGRCQRMSY
ncbi:hypothetical protein NQ176_g9828 [Zarea fungicola]|uniref:Uncharacterized protein n=1 Tax=Zarea fungicola TaxID=93591 RepID=A0ACC1MJT4_9HYPO|nr:hypothetical protein NQ176_g9828 [Lecanicillium fungicola]